MRVLVANIPTRRNRYLADLNAGLGMHCDVTHSSDDFWDMKGDYDVVHMHWPEYITYEIEAAYNSQLTPSLITALAERLRFWSDRSRIVVTRHNPFPYNAPEDSAWLKVYELVFSHAAGVVHMANASIAEFQERYSNLARNISGRIEHAIVPIQNYGSLPNTVSREVARDRLRIASDARVILVFGAIRTDAEAKLIVDTFDGLPIKRKILLASSWRESGGGRTRIGRAIRAIRRTAIGVRHDRRFNYGYVDDADAQLYLNAADILFIPRLWLLNSANVSLGMTFGLVTVGPDAGNAGEILKETGNPVFDPSAPDTAVDAVTEGLRLAAEDTLGNANRSYALSEWSLERCARGYVDFFEQVTGKLSARRNIP